MPSVPDGGDSTFGIYSGLHIRGGSPPMSRSTMAEQQPAKSSPSLTDDRRKALNLAITQIEKTCGKGSIMRMGADTPQVRVGAISTGAINLDAAIGIGGIPRGRVTEIFGPESSGKTTLALHVVAHAQREGGAAAYIAADHPLAYLRHLHQSAAREDRDHVRQSRNDERRPGAEILRLRAAGHAAHRAGEGARDGHRQSRARESREEQSGAAVPPGGVRHHVRRRD